MKILVVDDDPICRKIVVSKLKGIEDIDVSEGEDGNKARALLKCNHYDGVIIDWQMPGKSGVEIVREIRKTHGTMPLLMVSGEAEKERVIEAIRAGVTDYLVKPFDPEMLQAKLAKFVELAHPKTPALRV